MDCTVIRAHACATDAEKVQSWLKRFDVKGGFGSKVHTLCDALGMQMKFILTGSQVAELQAGNTLAGKRQCFTGVGG